MRGFFLYAILRFHESRQNINKTCYISAKYYIYEEFGKLINPEASYHPYYSPLYLFQLFFNILPVILCTGMEMWLCQSFVYCMKISSDLVSSTDIFWYPAGRYLVPLRTSFLITMWQLENNEGATTLLKFPAPLLYPFFGLNRI